MWKYDWFHRNSYHWPGLLINLVFKFDSRDKIIPCLETPLAALRSCKWVMIISLLLFFCLQKYCSSLLRFSRIPSAHDPFYQLILSLKLIERVVHDRQDELIERVVHELKEFAKILITITMKSTSVDKEILGESINSSLLICRWKFLSTASK